MQRLPPVKPTAFASQHPRNLGMEQMQDGRVIKKGLNGHQSGSPAP
jgi:hypothetical protein